MSASGPSGPLVFLTISFFRALPFCPYFQVGRGLLEGVHLISQGRGIGLLFLFSIITHDIRLFRKSEILFVFRSHDKIPNDIVW